MNDDYFFDIEEQSTSNHSDSSSDGNVEFNNYLDLIDSLEQKTCSKYMSTTVVSPSNKQDSACSPGYSFPSEPKTKNTRDNDEHEAFNNSGTRTADQRQLFTEQLQNTNSNSNTFKVDQKHRVKDQLAQSVHSEATSLSSVSIKNEKRFELRKLSRANSLGLSRHGSSTSLNTFGGGLRRSYSLYGAIGQSNTFNQDNNRFGSSSNIGSKYQSSQTDPPVVMGENLESTHRDAEEEIITQALRDVVYHAYGVVAAEVWVVQNYSSHGENSSNYISSAGLQSPPWQNLSRQNSISSFLPASPVSPVPFVGRLRNFLSGAQTHKLNSDEGSARLVQPAGGWLIDDVFKMNHTIDNDPDAYEALQALQNPSHPKYAKPVPTYPGIGLAGTFWAESSNEKREDCTWRDLRLMASDPYQPPEPRLQLLSKVFGKACAFSFNIRNHKGLVIYYARGSASDSDLSSEENLHYLRGSSDLIGAVSAWHDPRQKAIVSKQKRKHKRRSLLRSMSSRILHQAKEIEYELIPNNEEEIVRKERCEISCRQLTKLANEIFIHRALVWGRKWRGSSLKPPPPAPSLQSFITFTGALFAIVILSYLSVLVESISNGDYQIVLAPFGALVTLQYALTSAPMGQPRNTIIGQALAMSVAILLNKIPDSIMDSWIRVAVAPALAIGLMSRLGIQHPPAGAAAIAFTQIKANWINFALNLAAAVCAVLISACYNNLFTNRQYPTYWGLDGSFLFEYPGILSWSVEKKKKVIT